MRAQQDLSFQTLAFMSCSAMELELGLGLPNNTTKMDTVDMNGVKKRRLNEAIQKRVSPPLSEDAESDCDDGDNREVVSSFFRTKEIVGWPPVKSSLTKSGNYHTEESACCYVKVNMEGVFVGRKIDLSVHHSYDDLFATLVRIFPYKLQDDNMNSSSHHRRRHHQVAYEDEDGDWMLVGDVPWENFVNSVRRIKIIG